MPEIIHKALSYKVQGVLFDVHNQLGPGLSEKLYQQAVEIGLETAGIKCQSKKGFEVFYRGQRVGLYYVDLWLEQGKILLELKATQEITSLHQAQALSYLKVTQADLAIVANFGAVNLETQRFPNYLRETTTANSAWTPPTATEQIRFPELTHRMLQLCYRVYLSLGPGFLHQVYRRAVMVELAHQQIPYVYIKNIPITYQGQLLDKHPVRLIGVEAKVLIAAIAVKQLTPAMQMRLWNRLK